MARKAAWRNRGAQKKVTLKCGCVRHNWGLTRCAKHQAAREYAKLEKQAWKEVLFDSNISAGIKALYPDAIKKKIMEIKIRNMPLSAKP